MAARKASPPRPAGRRARPPPRLAGPRTARPSPATPIGAGRGGLDPNPAPGPGSPRRSGPRIRNADPSDRHPHTIPTHDAPATPARVGPPAGRWERSSDPIMKLIIAIIQPTKLEAVKVALSKVEVYRLTVMDVQGFGRQKGFTEVYRGHEFTVNLLRKIELQIAVNEDFVEPTIDAIIDAARSGPEGEIGDGKIFVLPMDDCIRIRTGERGPEAI